MTTIDPYPRRCEQAAYIIAGLTLVLTLKLHLLAALFSGFLVYEMVYVLVRVFRLQQLAGKRAKLLAVALIATIIVGLLTVMMAWLVTMIRGVDDSFPRLAQMLAEALGESRDLLPASIIQYLPANVGELRLTAAEWLRNHADDLKIIGHETLRTLAHMLIGMVVGAILSLREVMPGDTSSRPLAAAMINRVKRFGDAFRRIVFAQVRISAINTFLTWLYIGVALPLLGYELPYIKTLITITFLAGLLPVVGNLISNTVLVAVSLTYSFWLAISSLSFLIVIHKLEYFLNAHIIATRIRASAWELLLAMLVMEAAFGFRGLIAAPVCYAYLKDELNSRGLV
jgi:predicted PurR-regulated permease PerM